VVRKARPEISNPQAGISSATQLSVFIQTQESNGGIEVPATADTGCEGLKGLVIGRNHAEMLVQQGAMTFSTFLERQAISIMPERKQVYMSISSR
jgi:hypothetical protein